MSEKAELAVVPPKETALAVYSVVNGLDPYLQKIRDEIDSFKPDVSTAKGRQAITSMAYKVVRSRTALDSFGKQLSAEQKEVPKQIDAERKRMREKLESWEDEVKRPLTEWQAAEDARIDRHNDLIKELFKDPASNLDGVEAIHLTTRIMGVESVTLGERWEEFEVDAARAKDASLTTLRSALATRQQYEADQAELAQRRAEDAARERREHDERIAREAAEQTQKDADAAAQTERDAAARREQELLDRANESKRVAAQAEIDRVAAEERTERVRKDSTARAERAAEEARKAERKRHQDEVDEKQRVADARAADKAHKAVVASEALKAFVENGIDEAIAKKVINLIYLRLIPAIAITY